jgi:streptogramin lyase
VVTTINLKEIKRCCYSVQEAEGSLWVSAASGNTPRLFRVNPNVSPPEIVPLEPRSAGGIVGFGSLWVALQKGADAGLHRLDVRTGQEQAAAIPVKGQVFVSDDAVWVANDKARLLFRVDPKTNQVTARIPLDIRSWGSGDIRYSMWTGSVIPGAGSVWIVRKNGIISRINPDSNQSLAEIELGGDLSYVAIGEGSLWVLGRDIVRGGWTTQDSWSTYVVRVDTKTNLVVARIPICGYGYAFGIVEQDGFVWVGVRPGDTHSPGNYIAKIDPQTNQVSNIILPPKARGERIAAGENNILFWDGSGDENVIYRISAR